MSSANSSWPIRRLSGRRLSLQGKPRRSAMRLLPAYGSSQGGGMDGQDGEFSRCLSSKLGAERRVSLIPQGASEQDGYAGTGCRDSTMVSYAVGAGSGVL